MLIFCALWSMENCCAILYLSHISNALKNKLISGNLKNNSFLRMLPWSENKNQDSDFWWKWKGKNKTYELHDKIYTFISIKMLISSTKETYVLRRIHSLSLCSFLPRESSYQCCIIWPSEHNLIFISKDLLTYLSHLNFL